MRVYGIQTCRTTKKTVAWLRENSICFDFHDLRKAGITAGKLEEWDMKTGYKNFLNKKSLTWKYVDPQAKAAAKIRVNALSLLQQKPEIIKRAVLEDGDFLFFGFDEKTFENHFLKK